MAPYTQRKRKTKTNQLNHNICPATGEEEEEQQQLQNGGVSTKKVESLSNTTVFPPPPPPQQLLDIAAHESLLTRLGLWDFLNLDLGETIREDLIKEVVVSYKYNPRKYTGESRVKDVSISLDRTAVANALRLPVDRAAKGGSFSVSEEESLFLQKLFWGHLVLRDNGEDANHYVLEFVKALKEMRFLKNDWAGLVWCMMQRELLKGKDLVKCYYASHLQLVLKNQRPELFEDIDRVIEGGSLNGVCQSDPVDSLDNGAKLLLNLQTDLNAEIHYSENEDEVHTSDSLHAPCITIQEAHDKAVERDTSTDGLESLDIQETESQQKRVKFIETRYEPEVEVKSTAEINEDRTHIAGDEMDCQEAEYAGTEVESGASVDFFLAQEAHDDLDTKKIENNKKVSITDELLDVEMDRDGGIELGLTLCVKEDDAKKLHKIQVDLNAEIHSSKQEDYVMQNEAACGISTDNAPKVHFTKEDYVVQDVVDETFITDNALKVHSFKEDDVVLDEESDTSTGDSFDLPCVTLEDHLQPEFKFKNLAEKKGASLAEFSAEELDCPEVDMNCMADDTGKEVKSVASVDLLVTREAHDLGVKKEGSSDCLDSQEIENQHQSEHEFINATEMNGDGMIANVADDAMDCKESDLNFMVDNAGMETESGTSIDLLVRKDTSTDGLDSQETENQQKKVKIIENQAVPLGSSRVNSGNKLIYEDTHWIQQKKVNNVDELLDVEMDHGGTESRLIQSDKEYDAQKLHKVQVDLNAEIPSSEQEDDVMQNEANEAVYDTTDNALKGHCTKDHVVQYEADEGVSKASTDSALKVHCLKEDDGVLDEGSEACAADSYNAPCITLEEAHGEVVEEALHCQEIENEQRKVKIVENQFKPELELKSAAEMNGDSRADVAGDEMMDCQESDNAGMEVDSGASVDLLVAQEAYDDVVKNKDSIEGMDKIENQAVHLGSSQENSGNKLIFEDDHWIQQKSVNNIYQLLDIEMDHNGGTELGLTQSDKEDDAHKLHKVQNDAPETQQVGGEVERHVPEGFMLHCTSNMLELDLDLCAEKMKVWTARFTDSARRKVKENHNTTTMLQNKIEEQNHLIEQYEFVLQKERQEKQQYEVMLQKERQEKQTKDHRYNRELHLIQSVMEDYRKAIIQTNNSFAKYRERAQFPGEPLYMPHPDGGGNVILVSEWKKLEEERQKMDMKAMVDGFENVWSAYLETELSILNQLCGRLEGLEHDVKAMSGRL